jgi:hypothetical protein
VNDAGSLTAREDLPEYLTGVASRLPQIDEPLPRDLRAPIENQEVWAAGVTYFRSRTARIEESRAATGGGFYDLVYNADRPELFSKRLRGGSSHQVRRCGSGAMRDGTSPNPNWHCWSLRAVGSSDTPLATI